jgi:uncharacterized protein YndB with AHSA1/START domain
MATVRRNRLVAAPPAEVWAVVSNPDHLPRWWPGVVRVEDVDRERFTEVHVSKRGRTVRLDFEITVSREPEERAWEQELIGTPFERYLRESRVAVRLTEQEAGTLVTVELRHSPRGVSLVGGGLLLARAGRRRAEEALDGLERLFR